jgi:hypothetical protein
LFAAVDNMLRANSNMGGMTNGKAAHEARKKEAASPRIANLGRTGGDRRIISAFNVSLPESPLKRAVDRCPIHVRQIVAPAWEEVNQGASDHSPCLSPAGGKGFTGLPRASAGLNPWRI